MNFLPIVHRELRVAARRKSTFRIRIWSAVTCGVAVLLLTAMTLQGSGANGGAAAFSIITGYSFGLCALAGVFLTADCIVEEKQAGTLGFLFLTDLKGFDIVLGKFTSAGLNAFYGLLATFPIWAITVLLGGVTGEQLWRMGFALANTLFVSLACGIFGSTLASETQRAQVGTLLMVIVLMVLLPLLAWVASLRFDFLWVAWISPYFPFSYSRSGLSGAVYPFWPAFVISHFFGWLVLAATSFILPKIWQQKSAITSRHVRQMTVPAATSASVRLRTRRKQLLATNPILAIAASETLPNRMAWAVVGVWVCVLALALPTILREEWFLAFQFALPFGFIIKCILAVQACRFFVDARTTGALELFLATPLTGAEIIRGQMLALKRAFMAPLLTFTLIAFVPALVEAAQLIYSEKHSGNADSSSILFAFIFILRTAADCYTVSIVGIACALTLKNPRRALITTIAIVLVAPSVFCWLDIFADLILIAWASSRLDTDLRRQTNYHWLYAAQKG